MGDLGVVSWVLFGPWMPGSSPKTVSKAPAMRLSVPGPEGDSCPSGQPYLSSSPTKSRRKKTRRRSPQLVSRPDTGEPKQSIIAIGLPE